MLTADTDFRRTGSNPNKRREGRMISTIIEINPIPLAFELGRDENYLMLGSWSTQSI
jgi:hypothetical protein